MQLGLRFDYQFTYLDLHQLAYAILCYLGEMWIWWDLLFGLHQMLASSERRLQYNSSQIHIQTTALSILDCKPLCTSAVESLNENTGKLFWEKFSSSLISRASLIWEMPPNCFLQIHVLYIVLLLKQNLRRKPVTYYTSHWCGPTLQVFMTIPTEISTTSWLMVYRQLSLTLP